MLAVDIITADVLATAIIAGGESVRDALLDSYGEAIDVVTVDAAAHVEATPRLTDVAGFERGLAGLAQARNRRNGHSGADED